MVTLIAVLLVSAVAVIINIVICRFQNRPVSFFGRSFAIVASQSMEPEICKGDLIVFKTCDYKDVEVDNVIVFVGGDGFGSLEGQLIVHSVVEIREDGMVTKGVNADTNPMPDRDLVTAENLLGICVYNSAFWGKAFNIFSRYGILIIVALIFIYVFVYKLVASRAK